jgi:hypothetical protein
VEAGTGPQALDEESSPEGVGPRGCTRTGLRGLRTTRSTGPMANPRHAGEGMLTVDLPRNAPSPLALQGKRLIASV